MKYALKPSSKLLDIAGSNKIIIFKDEHSLFKFFHLKMQQDLMTPVVKSERYRWRDRNKPNDISPTDVVGVYSLLVSSNLDFQFLCSSRRIGQFLHENLPNSKDRWSHYKITDRMRSLPSNWTLYELIEKDGGVIMKSTGWGNFFRAAKKEKLLKDVNISYRIPETE
jgi:hypothetical protein